MTAGGLEFALLQRLRWKRAVQLRVKRALDVVAAVTGIVLLSPLLLAIGIAVRVDSAGPALFRQQRVGRAGRPFVILKFRTMRVENEDVTGVRQTVTDDPRLTRIGHLLRRWDLDELPQLFNVLAGDMSLVGPRPHVAGQLAAGRPYAEVMPHYARRHAMPPGLTGWAQVNGWRGPTDTIERAKGRLDCDLAYIADFNLLLDVRIIAMTLAMEFRRRT